MGLRQYVPLSNPKDIHMIMKSIAIVIPLVEFDICFLELEYVNYSHNK